MIEKFVDFQIKHARVLFVILLLIFGGATYVAKDLQIDPDFGALVSDDSEFNTNDRILTNAFEQNDAILILIKRDEQTILPNAIQDMRDSRVTQYIADLQETVAQSPFVLEVVGPQYSEDGTAVQLVLAMAAPDKVGGFEESLAQINTLAGEVGEPPGIDATVTGLPVLLDRVSRLLITDSLVTVLLTLTFIFLVLLWYSKDIYFTLVTLSTPTISLVLLAAVMVILGIDVTITLAAVGVLVIGLGADYSIHVATHYRTARREHENHREALIHTVDSLYIPITASFITTFAGFTALMFGVSPSSQAQGLVLSLGTIAIYLVSLLWYPILLTVFSSKIKVESNQTFRKIVGLLTKLAIFQTKKPKLVVTIIAILTVVMIGGASQVQFSTSNSNWIPDGDPVSEDFREQIYLYGNTDSITLVIKAKAEDLRNVQTAKDLEILRTQLEGIPNVDTVRSPYRDLELSRASLSDTLSQDEELREQFNYDYTLTRLTVVSENLRQNEAGDSIVLNDVREVLEKTPVHNAEISLYGDVVRFDELGDSLEQDAGVTTLLGLALVFFVASAIYASVVVGFLALLPIVIAVIWAVGLMGYFGVPFTSLSTGIISLVLGIGVDFSIHLVDSIKKLLKRGKTLEDSITRTLETSGAAIMLSSFTTFVGFLALTLATLLGTQRLGWSLAFSMISVFVVAITIVPALISLTHKKKKKV